MKLYEAFDRNPREARLANNGQARITGQTDAKATAELREELQDFVCEGQYAHATQLILERYLGNLDHTKQDSAWVSGFFGSGKSHLLKMLAHLWVNTEFEDGARARNLPRRGLPDEVLAHLRELDTQALRTKLPAVAAAGTLLGGTDRVRETVLAIMLRAQGWPTQYPQAKFCFWLREQGWLEQIRTVIEDAGKDWLRELNNLYFSPLLRRSLLEADTNIAADEKGVSRVLQSQFPPLATDITTAQFTETVKQALTDGGEIPLTLLVLDEVQQYINEASDRAATITEIAEAIQTQFDSRIMLVGAGQSALSGGTQALMWLRDRFKISIELADADVETVIRQVLLHKKASAVPAIAEMLEKNAGEVARHLQGTKIAERTEDRRTRVEDYPQLPTRRRFWEACFRAVDAAGTHSQLRSQLRILHDILHDLAEHDLGTVVPASELFRALAPDMVNTGVLLNEINTRIAKLDNDTPEGRLQHDLCGLVFLIGKLPREAGVDLGVRADAQTLADLMVDNVNGDSGPFRQRVKETLETLAEAGTLMPVGSEYRLQTTEGAEWDRAFREKQSALRQDEATIATRRQHLFGERVQCLVGSIKLVQGESKVRRSLSMHVGDSLPTGEADSVVVWLRDGWGTSERDVAAEARRLGQDDPALHLYLPRRSADELKARIIDVEAAQQVLDHYGHPSTPEGREAREGMESRLRTAEAARDEIVEDILRASKLLQGGGSEVFGEALQDKLKAGSESSLARLFPRFDEGDHRAWETAVKRAKDGSDQPFKIVGWDKATEDHPVAKQVIETIGPNELGSKVQKKLKSAPYGWPQDAIDAALLALHRNGHLRARQKSNRQTMRPGALDQGSLKATEFYPEKVRLTTAEKITIRGLYKKAGVQTKSGEEELRAADFLRMLREMASRAGGAAPLPEPPDTQPLDELESLTGSEQLGKILEHREVLEESLQRWRELQNRASQREEKWALITVLRRHAQGLEVLGETGSEADAIFEQRSLLSDTDHVTPLANRLASAVREALALKHAALTKAIDEALKGLADDATWNQLAAQSQKSIAKANGLVRPPALKTTTNADLRASLEDRSLSGWQAEIDAVQSRVVGALEEAARELRSTNPEARETVTVVVRRGTLSDRGEADEWLDDLGKEIKAAISKGPVIIK
jgi:hypothetical protein